MQEPVSQNYGTDDSHIVPEQGAIQPVAGTGFVVDNDDDDDDDIVTGPTVEAHVDLAKTSCKVLLIITVANTYIIILQQLLVFIQMILQLALMNIIFAFSFKSFCMLKHIQNHHQINYQNLLIYLLSMTRLQYILLQWPHFILQVIYLD